MPSKNDIIDAKRVLSSRLLGEAARHHVVARGFRSRLRAATADLQSNVHAVGIGRKVVEGQPTSTLAVRLYVVQKFAPSAIPPRDLLPPSLDGVPCDVVEAAPAFITQAKAVARRSSRRRSVRRAGATAAAASCTSDRRNRQRPFPAGVSVAHRDVTAGTLGYFCRSTRAGDSPEEVFLLSNNHVLADVNNAVAGDRVLQQSPADGGTMQEHVASLHRFVRIRLGGDVGNRVDAAIARLLENVPHTVTMCEIGRIAGTATAVEGMRVRKHGRTTGLTEGFVDDESIDAVVGMDHDDPSVVALFQNQLRLERVAPFPSFGLGGDSGSLVVAGDGLNAVGLYFAGPPSGVYGLANPIADVLSELEVQLIV
jgi:hypothetical protein